MSPNWKSPHAAAAEARRAHDPNAPEKSKARDYIGPAAAAVGTALGTSVTQNAQLISAIIVAQALDRLSEKIVEAAAIGKRA